MSSNSFVYVIFQKNLNPNSFVCLPIHSYIFPEKIKPQFIRMSSNSFVYLQTPPAHFQLDFCFPGVCSSMSTSKPRRSTFSLISASRGFALACPRPNPAEALWAWFLLPGGLLWHVHLQTPPKHFQPDFCFPGFVLACPALTPIHSYVSQFIRISSKNKICTPVVCLPIHSNIFQKKLNPKSFVCLPIHSYIFPKNWTPIHSHVFQFIHTSSKKQSEHQFIRMSSNSFVYLPKKIRTPIHSYVFQFIRISSNKKTEDQFIRMSSTIHSYIFQKKLNPNSFVCLPIHSYIFKKNWTPIHSYVFQFIRISSNPAEALSAWFLLPGGLRWHVHRQAPPKHFQLDFFFPGVCSILLWHVHLQTPPKHFQRDFCFPGVCPGMSTAKPRRSTFGLISASWGFALACPPPNPTEALSAWLLLRGGLDLLRPKSKCCLNERRPQSI